MEIPFCTEVIFQCDCAIHWSWEVFIFYDIENTVFSLAWPSMCENDSIDIRRNDGKANWHSAKHSIFVKIQSPSALEEATIVKPEEKLYGILAAAREACLHSTWREAGCLKIRRGNDVPFYNEAGHYLTMLVILLQYSVWYSVKVLEKRDINSEVTDLLFNLLIFYEMKWGSHY